MAVIVAVFFVMTMQLLTASHGADENFDKRLKVAVYYEALCPDSKHFIVQQLHNHYDTVEQFLDIQLIPYGKAKTIGSGVDSTFQCQHGPSECWGNKIHACGIQQANSQRVAVEFASCLMRHYFRLTADSAQTCAENSGLSWSDISTCVKSTDVNVLMERYGELTHALRPAVTFIPTITVDESQSDQRKLRNRFVQTICSIYQMVDSVIKSALGDFLSPRNYRKDSQSFPD